jgi:hypothetical protein
VNPLHESATCVAFVSLLLTSPAARAQSTANVCSDAYVNGQHQLHDRQFVEARKTLLVCARDPCPHALQSDCAEWLAEAERSIPSIVVEARGADGEELRRVNVLLDGKPFVDDLDGRAVDLDPGEHTLRLEAPGQVPLEQSVLIREGEKTRVLSLRFTAAAPVTAAPVSPPSSTPARSSWALYTTGAAAVTGAVVWAVFGARGIALRNQIESCTAGCGSPDRGALDVDWDVADVAAGVTIAAAGLATYLLVHRRAEASRTSLVVSPTGPGLSLSGTF